MGSGDYIFRDDPTGKLEFVGNFDALYAEQPDPWGQSAKGGCTNEITAYYDFSRRRLLRSLRPHIANMDDFCGLEVGCGHGYVVDILASVPFKPNWEGMDISRAAVDRASELFPQYTFFVGDLTKDREFFLPRSNSYSVVVLGQVWWYLLHKLQRSLNNCYQILRPGGLLVVSQAFLENQRYGADVADGILGALDFFAQSHMKSRWRLLEVHYDDMLPGNYRDGLIVLRKL